GSNWLAVTGPSGRQGSLREGYIGLEGTCCQQSTPNRCLFRGGYRKGGFIDPRIYDRSLELLRQTNTSMSLFKTLVASRNQAGQRGICPGKAGMADRDLRR
ncbi:hypothetical protein T310_10271, partial [Rasamsonia emersonii CBS 393.64]